jgi:hypothetical protein
LNSPKKDGTTRFLTFYTLILTKATIFDFSAWKKANPSQSQLYTLITPVQPIRGESPLLIYRVYQIVERGRFLVETLS